MDDRGTPRGGVRVGCLFGGRREVEGKRGREGRERGVEAGDGVRGRCEGTSRWMFGSRTVLFACLVAVYIDFE